jgi:hypothetical protein
VTAALCVKCGAEKFGSFTPCSKCGFFPETEDDFVYSLVLSDHYFSLNTLSEIGKHIAASGCTFRLPPDQEEEFRKLIRESPTVSALRARQKPVTE